MRILIDGNLLAFRTWKTANFTLTTSDGRTSTVIHAFLKSLNWVLSEISGKFSDVTVVWDGGRSKKRMELCPEYKTGRHKDPQTEEEKKELSDFFAQMNALEKILPTMGANSIRVKNVEADDVIGILAYIDETPTYIFSSDKDFHQLVSDHVAIIGPKEGVIPRQTILYMWNAKSVSDITILRAIIGDTSDKIPGIRGIGPAKSVKALYHLNSKEHQKYLENLDLVQRNIKIMQLPRSFQESFYSPSEIYEIKRQMNTPHPFCSLAFFDHCQQWELEEISEITRF